MENFSITTSDLINRNQGPSLPESNSPGLAATCWEWAGQHRTAIGVALGLGALAAGSAAFSRYVIPGIGGRLEAGAALEIPSLSLGLEAGLASKSAGVATRLETAAISKAVNSGARFEAGATAKSTADELAELLKDSSSLPAPATAVKAAESPQELVARIEAARKRAALDASFAGKGQAMDGAAMVGPGVPGESVIMYAADGTPYVTGPGGERLTVPEWLLRSTHDGGAHHAGEVPSNFLRDLLGVDPQPGTRRFIDQTLQDVRRAQEDVPTTFSRHVPALNPEMPALSVRPKRSSGMF